MEDEEEGEHTVLINTIETGQQHTAEPLVSCDDEIRSESGEEGDGLDGSNDAPSVNVGSPTSSTSSSTSSLASVKTVVNIQNASMQQLDETQCLDTP